MNRKQQRQRHHRRQQHLEAQAARRQETGEKAKPKPNVKQPRKQ